MSALRVAIAHDYLTQRGGAERVVLAMLRAFPDATIYTTLYDPEGTYPEFRDARIVTSGLNRFGVFRRHHRVALPLLPFASGLLQVDADVVIVSTSGWAHGFPTSGRRVVYCYSPPRWLYLTREYLGGPAWSSPLGWALTAAKPFLIANDKARARRAGRYLAISRVVAERIARVYGITAEVVPAPHSYDASAPTEPVPALADWAEGGYHLVVSRLLPYKNVDKVVDALRTLPQERLVVIGRGPLEAELRAALPANARLVSGLSDAQMRWAYAHCTDLIAPSFEDFGLTPLEAGVYGKPSLTLRAGGFLDTIAEGVSGAHFDRATPEAIAAAIVANRGRAWDADAVRAQAARFEEHHFAQRLHAEVAALT